MFSWAHLLLGRERFRSTATLLKEAGKQERQERQERSSWTRSPPWSPVFLPFLRSCLLFETFRFNGVAPFRARPSQHKRGSGRGTQHFLLREQALATLVKERSEAAKILSGRVMVARSRRPPRQTIEKSCGDSSVPVHFLPLHLARSGYRFGIQRQCLK